MKQDVEEYLKDKKDIIDKIEKLNKEIQSLEKSIILKVEEVEEIKRRIRGMEK
jgi:cell division septum initiation protein DivIVA